MVVTLQTGDDGQRAPAVLVRVRDRLVLTSQMPVTFMYRSLPRRSHNDDSCMIPSSKCTLRFTARNSSGYEPFGTSSYGNCLKFLLAISPVFFRQKIVHSDVIFSLWVRV